MFNTGSSPTKIGRNERCPCGSGKKYKYCCIDDQNCDRGDARFTSSAQNFSPSESASSNASIIQAWATALEAHGGPNWASNLFYRVSFENLVWCWFPQLRIALKDAISETLKHDLALRQALYANNSTLLRQDDYADETFWFALFKETPQSLRSRLESQALKRLMTWYSPAISSTFVHLWQACCSGEFVLVRTKTLKGRELPECSQQEAQDQLISYQNLIQAVKTSLPESITHFSAVASRFSSGVAMQSIFKSFWETQCLVEASCHAPHFNCFLPQESSAGLEFSLPPFGEILSMGSKEKMQIATHEYRTTFVIPICNQLVACTRDDRSDPQAAAIPLLASQLNSLTLSSAGSSISAPDASSIVKLYSRQTRLNPLSSGFLFVELAKNWQTAESAALQSIWESGRRATAKAVAFEILKSFKQEWQASPAETQQLFRPLFAPKTAEELVHFSQLFDSCLSASSGLRGLKLKAAHLMEFAGPQFSQELKGSAKAKKASQPRNWRLRRSAAVAGSAKLQSLADHLRLLKRLSDFMHAHQKKRGIDLVFHCQLDSAKGAESFQVDCASSTLMVSAEALSLPWHQLRHVGEWALGHFLARHYEVQDKAREEAWALAWKRLNMKPDLRLTRTSLEHPPTDWFDESGSMTAEQKRFIEKVNKLLALGQSNNENEATLAMERAQELIRNSNLNAARVLHGQESGSEGDLWHSFDMMHLYLGASSLSTPIRRIGSLLTKHYEVEIVYEAFPSAESSQDERVMTLIGRRESLLMAEHVFDFLLDRMDKLWESAKREKQMKAKHKMSYQLGLLRGFDLKLTQQAEQRKVAMGSAGYAEEGALIRLQNMKLDQFKSFLFPDLTTISQNKTHIDKEAYHTGHTAGQDLKMNQPISSATAKSSRSSVLQLMGFSDC